MKLIKSLLHLLFVAGIHVCNACDICGSSGGGFYLTPYGVNKSSVIGCRYSTQHFFSRKEEDRQEFSKDHYQVLEIFGNLLVGKHLMVSGSVPFKMNQQRTNLHPHHTEGFGDAIVQFNYIISSKGINQLWLGGGIKLPTGRFNPDLEFHPVPAANLEPGTGSLDLILNAADILKLGKWSLIGNARYKINGEAKGFRFGNRFSTSLLVSKNIAFGNRKLNFYGGGNFDVLGEDELYGAGKMDNGGYFISGVGGVEMELGKFGVGANGLLPVFQNLSGDQTKFRWGGMVQVGYRFGG